MRKGAYMMSAYRVGSKRCVRDSRIFVAVAPLGRKRLGEVHARIVFVAIRRVSRFCRHDPTDLTPALH